MVLYQIPPPKNFSFFKPEQWLKWFHQFQQFHQASDLTDKSSENQVNTLVYTMGDAANDIVSPFGITDDDKKNYDTSRNSNNILSRREMSYLNVLGSTNTSKKNENELTTL